MRRRSRTRKVLPQRVTPGKYRHVETGEQLWIQPCTTLVNLPEHISIKHLMLPDAAALGFLALHRQLIDSGVELTPEVAVVLDAALGLADVIENLVEDRILSGCDQGLEDD